MYFLALEVGFAFFGSFAFLISALNVPFTKYIVINFKIVCSAGIINLTVNYIRLTGVQVWLKILVSSEIRLVLYSVCGIDMPCGFLLWPPPPGVTPIPLSPHTFISETELLGINSSQKTPGMTPVLLYH